MATLYNATPTNLLINVSPDGSYIAAPGSNFTATTEAPNGSKNAYNFELHPYGYLPLYAAGGDSFDISVNVNIFENIVPLGSPVGSFTFKVDDACSKGTNFGTPNIHTYNSGYSLAHFGYHGSSGNGNPWGIWIPIQNSSLSPQ